MSEFVKKNFITLVLGAISAGWFADSLGLIKFNKELSSSDKTLLIEELRNDRNYYQSLYKQCSEDMAKISRDVDFLKGNIQVLTVVKNDLPVPIWLKSSAGKMIFLNDEYERLFLLPVGKTAKDYIGKTDFQIWDSSTASQFRKNDLKVLTGSYPETTTEYVPMLGDLPKKLRVVKYIAKANNKVIGIGGVGIFVE